MGRGRGEDYSVWQIAAGVALGILIAGAIGFFVRAWLAQRAIEQIGQQAQQMLIQQQKASQAAQAERERVAAVRAAAIRDETARRQRQEAAATAAVLDEKARREVAWAKFYKKPAHCDNQPNNETLVQCANEHIRAKRRFDTEYAAGKL